MVQCSILCCYRLLQRMLRPNFLDPILAERARASLNVALPLVIDACISASDFAVSDVVVEKLIFAVSELRTGVTTESAAKAYDSFVQAQLSEFIPEDVKGLLHLAIRAVRDLIVLRVCASTQGHLNRAVWTEALARAFGRDLGGEQQSQFRQSYNVQIVDNRRRRRRRRR